MLRKPMVGLYLCLVLFLASGLVASCGGAGGGGSSSPSGGPGGGTPTADITPPTVLSTSPTSGGTSVSILTALTATFSEAMDASTISAATFTVSPVTAGTVTIDTANRTAIFRPTYNFFSSTVYTATVTSGVKDAAGNTMTADKTWSFTTQAAPNGRPFIASISLAGGATLANGATNVGRYQHIEFHFNEPIDCLSYTITSSPGVNTSGSAVCGGGMIPSVSYGPGSLDWTYYSWAPNTTYTLTISGAKNLAGNTMIQESFSFTTGTNFI
jgi:hypothetical protein